jgi:hypothetical protein
MLRTRPDVEPHDVAVPPDLIPLSILTLDLNPSPLAWDAYLAGRNIPIVLDHIGRSAISSADARQLLDERREDELRQARIRQAAEQRAVEQDQQWRAQLPAGIAWHQIPPGATAADVWAQRERDSRPKRRTPLEDALAGDGMTYRPLQPEADQS